MLANRSLALFALLALLLASSTGSAKVYQDPTGTGNTDGGIAALDEIDTPLVLNIFIEDGNDPTITGTACEDGDGEEICGGDIEVRATGLVEIDSISNPGPGDTVFNHIDATRGKANYLDAINPDTAPIHIVTVTVSATGPGQVVVDGLNVDAALNGVAIPLTTLASTFVGTDTDGDGVVDSSDNCVFVPNGVGEASGQPTWGNQAASAQYPSVGCACLCGDPNRDCNVNVADASEAQRAGLVPPLSPLSVFFDITFCDINQTGTCDVGDAPEMQRAGLVPPLPPVSPGTFTVTGCSGYLGP